MRSLRILILQALVLLISSSSTFAHTIYTANGAPVNHGHYSYCGPNGCPASDSTFESTYGFRSADRYYSATGAWNCHGRTFDARLSWIPQAEPYINNDWPYCPLNPAAGDSIIWWGSNGLSSHSVTIVGTWNGLSTPVMSKYGTQGQYRHALSNVVAVYGSDWTVTNFDAGTAIYWGITKNQEPEEVEKRRRSSRERLIEQRKKTPWYEDVLASQLVYEVEHPRIVDQVARLTEESRTGIGKAKGDQERLDILLKDLQEDSHFEALNAFDSPAFSEDFIHAIESGNLLVKLSKLRPELRKKIANQLLEVILENNGNYPDRVRGAGLHFLNQILTPKERAETKKKLQALLGDKGVELNKKEMGVVSTYTQHYLEKM